MSDARAQEGGSVIPGFGDAADDPGDLIARLVARRRAHGLSQSEVAARMGTSQSAVARLESGQPDLRLSTLNRYAEAVATSVHFSLRARQQTAS